VDQAAVYYGEGCIAGAIATKRAHAYLVIVPLEICQSLDKLRAVQGGTDHPVYVGLDVLGLEMEEKMEHTRVNNVQQTNKTLLAREQAITITQQLNHTGTAPWLPLLTTSTFLGSFTHMARNYSCSYSPCMGLSHSIIMILINLM